MTQYGINNLANQSDRILPLPCLPTYIARRPISSKPNSEATIQPYNPIFAPNRRKSSDIHPAKHRHSSNSPFINIDLEPIQTSPKQYDTYKPYFYPRVEINLTDSFNRIRPLNVPNHTTRTSEKWSRFLDEYPDRFNIDYSLSNNDNDFRVENRPGRYPCGTSQEPLNLYGGLTSRIQPATNPFRQFDSKQTFTRPVWIPYGTAPRPYQTTRVS